MGVICQRNIHAKLTESEVKKIIKLKGELSSTKVTDLFDVSNSSIKLIWSGKTWKHVQR